MDEKTSDSKKEDVAADAEGALGSEDLLQVLGVTKAFNGTKVVDDVSLGVSRDMLFALLGPNGAGKTTTFNMIREWPFTRHNYASLKRLRRW